MAPFIGKHDGGFAKIPFPKCEWPNACLDIELKMTEGGDCTNHDEVNDEDTPKVPSSMAYELEAEVNSLKDQLDKSTLA